MDHSAIFDQKVTLITGASGSIGYSIAKKLAAKGVIPCFLVRDPDKLAPEELPPNIFPNGYRIFCADFARPGDIENLFEAFTKEFDHLDILVHCAGAIYLGEILKMPVESLDQLYAINVRAPLFLTQLFLPLLIKQQGQIVFMNSSVSNQATWSSNGAYAATKLAQKVVAETIRNEVNSKGVRVLAIYPGRTSSQMQKYIHEFENKAYVPENLLQPDDIGEMVVSALALPSSAEVTDIFIRPNKKT